MAKKATKEAKDAFKEFKFEGNNGNTFEGRLWVENVKETEKAVTTPISVTINGLVIVGAKLIEYGEKPFISFPQYQTKSGDYKNMVFFTNKDDIDDLTEFAKYLATL